MTPKILVPGTAEMGVFTVMDKAEGGGSGALAGGQLGA